jgi:hypothetical protein
LREDCVSKCARIVAAFFSVADLEDKLHTYRIAATVGVGKQP